MGNLLNILAAGTKTLLMAAEELGTDFEATTEVLTSSLWADWYGLSELVIRFLLNTAVIAFIVRVFYYPKSKRRDYFVTFILISISVFLLIFLMGGVKLKVGFALGLFARIHNDTPPVPTPTSRMDFAPSGANAANHTASDVGL